MPTAECGFQNSPGQLVTYGPTLLVEIGYDSNFRPDINIRPDLPPDRFEALVDTGAIATCVDSSLAIRLNLPVVDQQVVSGALGFGTVNIYRAQVYIPTLGSTFSGHIVGVHLDDRRRSHSALIGRDFLRQFRMVYDGRTGAVTLSND